jgi:hypothetical protein
MIKRKRVVLSEENINLLADLAESLGGAEEVRKDPNFVLSLFLSKVKERPGGDIAGVRLDSLDPDMIAGARKRLARNEAA